MSSPSLDGKLADSTVQKLKITSDTRRCDNSVASTKTYSAKCLNGKAVTVDGSAIRPVSTHKDWRLVCQACGVQRCDDTRLFRGYSKKDDRGRILTSSLEGLALQSYGSDEKAVSYKCPGKENAQTAQCQTSQTLKDCLVALCEQCRSSKCEVYAGSAKVSSGKVTMAKGVYGIDTKASAVEKLKKGLDAVKKVATSGKTKGIASAIGAAVMSNKDTITKLARIRRRARQQNRDRGSDPQSGKQLLAKDVNGGLIALAELTGHPLGEEEEQTIEREWRQTRRSTTPVYSLFSKRKATRRERRDLYQDSKDSFWGRHGFSRGNLCRRSDPDRRLFLLCAVLPVVSEEEGR
ncbi:hypothetical protein Q5P01_000163 [Channa striata]|uniref:Uncharacterized protein n=1 Tax=Channa striata TaxID=64152 RepID=A0AA88LM01_CHASR|nr:hypothetical protein Q5P01_000163 [Channa striata]